MSSMNAIDTTVLDQAATWLVQLHASEVSAAERAEWQRWHDADPQHARAWRRAEALLGRIGGLPPELAKPALGRDHDAMRRSVVTRLAVLLALAPTAWTAWRMGPEWTADYRTATGAQENIKLADGSAVMLNTATALNVRFDAQQRLLYLVSGEILIDTAADTQTPARPFLVETAQGRMQALGTRFVVRQREQGTDLTVLQGAVEIRPHESNEVLIVHAGEKVSFDAGLIGRPLPAGANDAAWSQGMLVADAMPLQSLAEELSRYRRGVIRVDPAVAKLPVSGAFPLDNTERSLSMLQSTYPLQLEFSTRYWVRLSAR